MGTVPFQIQCAAVRNHSENILLQPRFCWCAQSLFAYLEISQQSHFSSSQQQVCVGARRLMSSVTASLFTLGKINNMKWTHRGADSSRGIRSSLYRVKCSLDANCHIGASELWLPTGPSGGAECIFRLIASHKLTCPGRSGCWRWQCFEGSVLETSREQCVYLRWKIFFTCSQIVSCPVWD